MEKDTGNRKFLCSVRVTFVRFNKNQGIMFKELKETMLKEVKEGIKTVSHQIENINRNGNYKEEPNGKFGVEKFNN